MQSLGQEEYISGTPCTIYRACSFFSLPPSALFVHVTRVVSRFQNGASLSGGENRSRRWGGTPRPPLVT